MRKAEHLFRMSELQRAVVALHCASDMHARSKFASLRSVIKDGNFVPQAGGPHRRSNPIGDRGSSISFVQSLCKRVGFVCAHVQVAEAVATFLVRNKYAEPTAHFQR